ncbi:MAG: PAS domain S-box protein [Gemmatimonadaceae bacterium]|nr:PAS domain S-box protein [Gemmatimonadaceae bacterium]MCW5825823.1 PAS domain S-box protein [Gemmatimonadaceae bacterium]
MQDPSLAGLAPDASLEPRLRALLAELPPPQAAVLEELWRERERLLALAEHHRLVLQSATDAILVTSVGGVVEYANDASTLLFSTRKSLRGARLHELVASEEQELMRGYVQRALAGDAVRAQLSITRSDGDRRRVNVGLSPVREHGIVSGLVASFTDFTDEARARDEVAAANTRFRDLAEVAADAIWMVDRRGLFTSINPATLELTGYARGELLGRSAIPLIAPEDQQAVAGHFRAVLGGKRQRYECHLVRKDGSRRLISVANSPVLMHGVVSGILGVVRDITEERARSVAIERLEARWARLVDSAEDAIATMDEHGHFTSVNRALEKVSGRPRAALIGTHFVELLRPAERAELWRVFAATLGGERQRREVNFTRPDGAQRVATVLATPIIEEGQVTGVLAVARDVTDERRMQDSLVRQDKLAALGELMSGVTNEISAPLQEILAQVAKLKTLPGADAEVLDRVANEARRAARVVVKLQTFSHQNTADRMATDVNRVLEDTLELRRYPLAVQEIALDISLDRSLPTTWADPFQLQQVFINVLGNAEQAVARHQGERRIKVRTRSEGDNIVVEIADTGPGIAPEHLPHIFNPFYTTRPRGSGTGLGLSIADGITREHGGSLRVQSELGHGAQFDIVLPVVAPPTLPATE